MIAMRNQWRTFTAEASPAVYRILLHGMLFGLSFSIADMLFNFYLQSLGYDNLVSGQLQSSFRMAGVVLGIPIGMIIDRISAQRMLYIGILTYAIGWGVLLMVHGLTITTPVGVISPLQMMNVLYFVIGAANMATYTAVVPLLSTVIEPQQRASMFGVNAAASTMVGFVGSIVAGMLPGFIASLLGVSATSETAYRTALFGVCGFGLLAVVPLIGIQKAKHRMSKDAAATSVVVPDGARVPLYKLLLFATPSIFFGIAGGMFVPFQNLYFRQQFGASDSIVGLSIAFGSLAMGIGSILGGSLAKRLGIRRATSLSRFMAAPLMFMMLIPSFYVVSVAYDLNRMLVGLTFPLFSALMMQSVPLKQRGTATSMSSMTWSLGWAGASILSGYIQASGSFNTVIIVSGLSYVISAVLVQFMPYTDKLPD